MTVELLQKFQAARDDLLYLRQIQQAIDETEDFLADGVRDQKTLMAVCKEIEIVAEAAGNIPGYITTRYPDVPWRKISALRKRLSLEFSATNGNVVWDIAEHDLPKLKKQVSAILKTQESRKE